MPNRRRRPSRVRRFVVLGIYSFILAANPYASAQTVIYKNDFNRSLGSSFPEWSSSAVIYADRGLAGTTGSLPASAVTNVESPNGKARFLGEFGGHRIDPTAHTRVQETVRLRLDNLAPHSKARVEFDLLILKSWDGDSPQFGPDRLTLTVAGGPALLNHTFSNNPKTATEGSFQDYPQPKNLPHKGAVAVDRLGYKFFGDSAYRFRFTFPHRADSLELRFASDLFEGKGTEDESWGLDNVVVTIDAARASAPGQGEGAR